MRPLLTLLLLALHLYSAEIPSERAEIMRLQIFLDQQDFGPGVLDGKMGTYTKKAIEAYNKKFDRKANEWDKVKEDARLKIPDIYATAIVPDIVNEMVDSGFKHGDNRNYQSTRHDMPYRSVAEFMAERYHTSIGFLKLINQPGAVSNAKARTALLVPNVEPFRIELLAEGRTHKESPELSQRWAVIDTKAHQIRIYDAIDPPKAIPMNASPPQLAESSTDDTEAPAEPEENPTTEAPKTQQPLSAYDEHRATIIAAYPITPGKPQFIRYGTWKMINAIEFPSWRYDASLLKTGQRSTQSLQIPSGPNNPVGVLWMGLSRKGIGIHGTNNPEKIGRGRSAGCIRMANWDVVKLPKLIRPGAVVIIK